MKHLRRHLHHAHLISLGLGSSLIFGCFDSSSEGESSAPPEPLTHEEAHQLIDSTMRSGVNSLEERLRFLDGDRRLIEAFENLFPADQGEDCWYDFDENGDEIEVCEDLTGEDESGDNTIRIDFMEESSEMISSVLEELPSDLLIDGESQLTYRLNVNQLCEQLEDEGEEWDEDQEWNDDQEWEDEFAEAPESDEIPEAPEEEPQEQEIEIDPNCLRVMEREAPRVSIESYRDGIQATLLVAGGEERLVTAIMTSELVKVSADLGTISRIIKDIETEEGAEQTEGTFDLEMTGVVSLEMDMSAPNRAIARVNIDEAISITGRIEGLQELNLSFPAARNIFSISSDSQIPSINVGVAIPKLIESLQTSLNSEYEYNEETGEEVLVEEGPLREVIATLGGFDLSFNLELVEEGIATTVEVGLGQESTSIQIDGQEVLKIDLNPANGRSVTFDFDHSSLSEEALMVALASQLHALNIDLKLGLIDEIEAPLGLADELYKIAFTSAGGALPSLKLGGDQFAEVITGQLEISAERADISVSAEAGMCLSIDEEQGESFEESPEELEENESQHLLESLIAGVCLEREE